MNCSIMSWDQRTSRLAAVEGLLTSETLPKRCKGSLKRKSVETVSAPARKIRKEMPCLFRNLRVSSVKVKMIFFI